MTLDRQISIPWIRNENDFPSISSALTNPNGLLAAGGQLNDRYLLSAYKRGIFPWYSQNEPILWWSPDPRMVMYPEKLKVSRSLGKLWRQKRFRISVDKNFSAVINSCQRRKQPSEKTWITQEMLEAYVELHRKGYAHSFEVWESDILIGGLYGVAIGKIFFGESMFSFKPNASKLALIALTQQLKAKNFELIDCQVSSDHLSRMGGVEISRPKFALWLSRLVNYKTCRDLWNYSDV